MRHLLDGVQHVLWDWNGTLLDDAWLCIEVMNGVLARRRLPALDAIRYQELFTFPVRDYYVRLGFDFEEESFELVGTEFIEGYQCEQHACRLHPDAVRMLSFFRGRGLLQSVLSASQQKRLDEQVSRLGVREHFSKVLGIADHYASGKLQLAQRWLREEALEGSRVLLIGDTDHDAQVAAALGTRCVLIPRGHQSARRLATCGVPVLESLEKLAIG